MSLLTGEGPASRRTSSPLQDIRLTYENVKQDKLQPAPAPTPRRACGCADVPSGALAPSMVLGTEEECILSQVTEGLQGWEEGWTGGGLTDELQAKARELWPVMTGVDSRTLLYPWPVTGPL